MAIDTTMSLSDMAFNLKFIQKSFEQDEYKIQTLTDDIESVRSFLANLNHHASRLNSIPISDISRDYINSRLDIIGSELKKIQNINTDLDFEIRKDLCKNMLSVIILCIASEVSCLENNIDIRQK